MNLAGLPSEFRQPEAPVGPGGAPVLAYIVDRNPVLSECVSTSLSTYEPLRCHALAYDPIAPPMDMMPVPGGVLVFDPAQISSPLPEYLGLIDQSDTLNTVAYSFDTSDIAVNAALDAGVDCYASKEQDLSILFLAIATAAHGGRFLCPNIAQSFQRVRTQPCAGVTPEEDPKSMLSARELAVITALASGLSQKQTAFKLRLSDKTVSTYKSRAMRKLGLTDRASIVQFAMAQNLITAASQAV